MLVEVLFYRGKFTKLPFTKTGFTIGWNSCNLCDEEGSPDIHTLDHGRPSELYITAPKHLRALELQCWLKLLPAV